MLLTPFYEVDTDAYLFREKRWCTVPDLPREIDRHTAEPITDLFLGLEELAPILYKLDETLSGSDAERFLSAMQRFFCGGNLLTSDIDQDLLIGIDNLLRVMSCADAHENYRFEKIATAAQHFEKYRKRRALNTEFYFKRDPIPREIQYLHAAVMHVVEDAGDLSGGEMLLFRVLAALTEYGMMQGRPGELFPQVGPSLHRTLHDYLNYALVFHLNISLPDHVDRILIGDLHSYCRTAWENLDKEGRLFRVRQNLGELYLFEGAVLEKMTQLAGFPEESGFGVERGHWEQI